MASEYRLYVTVTVRATEDREDPHNVWDAHDVLDMAMESSTAREALNEAMANSGFEVASVQTGVPHLRPPAGPIEDGTCQVFGRTGEKCPVCGKDGA